MNAGCFSFFGNKRQDIPVCTKMFSSWIRKILSITEVHMSLGTLQTAAALAAGISLVSILQEGD